MAKRYEGSKADTAKDRREAEKRGMSMKTWERSAADKRMDREGQRRLDTKSKRR